MTKSEEDSNMVKGSPQSPGAGNEGYDPRAWRKELYNLSGQGDIDTVWLYRDRGRGEVGAGRRHSHQPQVVGLHGGHHGDQPGQQSGFH